MMLPQKAPRVSASQSPRSLPVRFSKNDWWNSSQIPISEREMVTVKMSVRQDGLFAKKSDAERRPLPPKKNPKWTILSKWGISKAKVPGGWNLFPWDSRLRTINQAVKQPIQNLGLWRNLLGVIPSWILPELDLRILLPAAAYLFLHSFGEPLFHHWLVI